jgi:hypothetical protein
MSEAKSIFAGWVARWRVKGGGCVFDDGVMKAVGLDCSVWMACDVVKSRRGQGLGKIVVDWEVLGALTVTEGAKNASGLGLHPGSTPHKIRGRQPEAHPLPRNLDGFHEFVVDIQLSFL